MVKPAVLDASAPLALLFDEAGARAVESLFSRRPAASCPVSIAAVNWAEVAYRTERRRPRDGAEVLRRLAETTPLQIVPVDRGLAESAARLKQGYGLPLSESFAAALAQAKAARLFTSDPDFGAVAKLLTIRWLR